MEEKIEQLIAAVAEQQRSIDLLKQTVGMIYGKLDKGGLLKPETKAEFAAVLNGLGVSVT